MKPSRLRGGMSRNNQFLIISQSGRALAVSAKRAGIDTHVIDLFVDEDTVESTLSNHSVTGFSGRSNSEALINIVTEYAINNPELRIVVGSGLEECPDLLAQLEQRFSVIGNHSSVVKQVKDPVGFFKRLGELALPYPDFFTDEDKPAESKGAFLIKTIGGAGGGHVRPYKKGMKLASICYCQVFLRGKNYSVTFLADGNSFRVLGFNETWVCDENRDFTFAGAVSNANLPNELCQQVIDAIRQLVQSFNLKGLCSLDFIVEEAGQYSILEINPRPTATFELYEFRESLFVQHLAAFNGKMPEPESDPGLSPESSQGLSRALGVLYAGESITIPSLKWPGWVTDRPKQGKPIAKGEPVCTVHAEGFDTTSAKEQLMMRLARQRALLGLSLKAA